jgi:hypothetical protein
MPSKRALVLLANLPVTDSRINTLTMRSKRESTCVEEGTHEAWPHADALDRLPQGGLQLPEVVRSEVGELDALEIAPDPFVGVEFGGVGWEVLEDQSMMVLADEPFDRHRLVRVDVVPDQDDAAPDVAEQMTKEDEDLRGGDGPGADQDVELPLPADAGDGGELRPAEAVPQDRSPSHRGPGANPGGDEAEAALVSEDERGFQPAGFFLIRGQSCRIQRRTVSSLRSNARPVGLWHDQPHCRSSFGTWLT